MREKTGGKKTELGDRAIETLEHVCRGLAVHYDRPEIEEIVINGPGVVHYRLRQNDAMGRWWREVHDANLTYDYLVTVIHAVANTFGQVWDPETIPSCMAALPRGHRFTAAAGKAIRYDLARPEGGVMLAIRQPGGERQHRLDAFGVRQGDGVGTQKAALRRVRKTPDDAYRALFEAAKDGRPLLFSGPTSSGKTTLLNMLLSEVDDHLRVLTIEDTPELKVMNPNRIFLSIGSELESGAKPDGRLTSAQIVHLTLRSTPDAVLVGEIQPNTAPVALELMKNGHSHFWTSIHAEDPEKAFDVFVDRVRHTQPTVDRADVRNTLRQMFTVIQTANMDGHRYITHIVPPEAKEKAPSRGAQSTQ